jgi:hypothetical protein
MPRIIAQVALSILGDRIEKGSEVDVSKDFLKALDPADYSLASDAQSEPKEEEKPVEVPLDEMSSAQLKERAKELGLKTSGSAADLRERITLHLSGSSDAQSEPKEEIIND